MTGKIKILLADDHNILREGIAQMLNAQPDMDVVAQAGDGSEALELAQACRPDVALLDINMPVMDGVEATRRITAMFPLMGIIILTMYRRDDYVFEAIKAGASGYLLKEVELDKLLEAIRAVSRGEAVLDPAMVGRVLAEIRQPRFGKQQTDKIMTERDVEILRLLALGLTNREIASKLDFSEKTVRNRLSRTFRLLNLKNRTQAALYAVRKGLVDPDNIDLD
jgi:DNA-binding NarL/FixJ family response regulator